MSIHINLAVVLYDWLRRYSINGPVLTLGVQKLGFQGKELDQALGRTINPIVDTRPLTARELFDGFGLGPATALDVSDHEGADIIFDLNKSDPPTQTRQRFGLIVNSGTLEHVFHVPNALANINRMLRPSGCVLHALPCNNWVDHGFYQFSPTLMFDYYAAAQFDLLESALMIFNPRRRDGNLWEIRACPPGHFGTDGHSSLDDRTYSHVSLVRRGNLDSERPIPIQSRYAGSRLRARCGPRWFSSFDLSYGARIDRPNRHIVPLSDFTHEQGLSWVADARELKGYSDSTAAPGRSPVIVLEDEHALGPPHSLHAAIREHGGGAYSHWGDQVMLSTSDDSDPNKNGRHYVAIVPPPSSF